MEKTTKFECRSAAWKFMHDCDDAGVMAGFPAPVKGPNGTLTGTYTVRWIPKA